MRQSAPAGVFEGMVGLGEGPEFQGCCYVSIHHNFALPFTNEVQIQEGV